MDQLIESVFDDDLLGQNVNWYFHVIKSCHWSVEVEILEIDGDKFEILNGLLCY